MTTPSEMASRYRHNFWCLTLDFCFFGIAMSFIGPSTVVPGLLTELGASAFIIGFVSTLQRAGWLLPQLLAARYLADKPYKKPYVILPSALSRPLFLVLAGVTWGFSARSTKLTIALFLPLYVLFWIGDGLSSLSWFELLSKAIPPKRRGRLTGVGQTLSGIFGFLAGIAVEWMLSEKGFAFPNNYASLFLTGFGLLALSFLSISFIDEPDGQSGKIVPRWRDFIPQLGHVLKHNRIFRRYIIARQFFNLNFLATPFYITHALETLQLPSQVVGRYTSIGVVGAVLAALLFGWINERQGTKCAMGISTLVTAAVPLTAILIPHLSGNSPWLAWTYGGVFFVLNASTSSMLPAWMAFLLELAPEAERPVYVGLTNTINGITTLFSTIGGLILQWTHSNYGFLFLITAAGTLLALPILINLPDPRK
ncbi:MAG: MFS transporter [Anaerolineae bacterium]|nr:MFS transporter [Anaerolineae bacterium]